MTRLAVVLALLTLGSSLAAEEKKLIHKYAEIEAKLEHPTEVQYLDTPLGDVVTDLELRHKINIELDIEALNAQGQGGSGMPISRSLKDIPFESALNLLLTGHELTWTLHDDVLLITTNEAERKYLQTKVYVVGDLGDDAETIETIGGIIMQTLSPETWRPTEGGYGSIAPYTKGKSLVVTHSTRMHRRIAKLLDDLRAVRD